MSYSWRTPSTLARTVLDALLTYMEEGGVEVRLRQRVTALLIEDGQLRGARTAEGGSRSGSVLIATGGLSYPSTGSTGDGYTLARQAGHAIVPTYPAIAALETREQWPRGLQGTPIRAAALCARDAAGRRLARARGDALWTHYGLSGPAASEVSTAAVRALLKGHEVSIECDLLPERPEEALEEDLRAAARTRPKMALKAALAGWVPRRTAEMLLELAHVGAATRLGQCPKAEARAVVELLKRLRVHVTRPRPVEEAIATGGGVSLEEVDSRTMESRLLAGLHFAGETLDVQGPCGGFNLQAAFSTGRLAGRSVGRQMRGGSA